MTRVRLPTELVMSAPMTPRAGFRERVEAAAAAGYDGIGLWPSDLRRIAEEGMTPASARGLLDGAGVRAVEVQVLFDWALGGELGARSRAFEERLYVMADALGGDFLLVNSELEGPPELTAERFAGLCDRAGAHGLVVALEPLPWTTVPDPISAWSIVEMAGRSNAGVLVDTWHLYRGGHQASILRRIPPARIVAIQLDDADPEPVGTLLEDTLHRRRLPGQGSFPLDDFFATLDAMGVRAPLVVEVISDETAARPAAEVARASIEATRRVLGWDG